MKKAKLIRIDYNEFTTCVKVYIDKDRSIEKDLSLIKKVLSAVNSSAEVEVEEVEVDIEL